MNKKKLILLVLVVLVIANTSLVAAMQQAEINQGDFSLGYGVHTLNGKILALNLEGDIGITPTLGLEGTFTYLGDRIKNNILDLNLKFGVVDNYDYSLSALLGYNAKLGKAAPRIGFLFSKPQSNYLDLNIGFDVLLKTQNNIVGYTLGIDYMLTRDLFVEVGHRKLSGQTDTEGLNIGMRYYF